MNRRKYIERIVAMTATVGLAGCTLLEGNDSGTTPDSTSTTQQTTVVQSTSGSPTQATTTSQTAASTPTQTPQQSSAGSAASTQSQTTVESEQPTTAVRTPEPTPTQTNAQTRTNTRTRTQAQTATRSRTATQTASSQVIDAVIVSFDPGTGTFSPGETQTAQVEVENLGNVRNTFYVGYSVVDSEGEGYANGGAPADITLSPGGSGSVTTDWTVTASSPEGMYGAKTTVRESWDGEDFGETLDSAEESDVFEVVQGR